MRNKNLEIGEIQVLTSELSNCERASVLNYMREAVEKRDSQN